MQVDGRVGPPGHPRRRGETAECAREPEAEASRVGLRAICRTRKDAKSGKRGRNDAAPSQMAGRDFQRTAKDGGPWSLPVQQPDDYGGASLGRQPNFSALSKLFPFSQTRDKRITVSLALGALWLSTRYVDRLLFRTGRFLSVLVSSVVWPVQGIVGGIDQTRAFHDENNACGPRICLRIDDGTGPEILQLTISPAAPSSAAPSRPSSGACRPSTST